MINFISGLITVTFYLALTTGLGYLSRSLFEKYNVYPVEEYDPSDYFIMGIIALGIVFVVLFFGVIIYSIGTGIVNQLFV